ncbi:MAG TPA: hypothetical protein VN428_09100 [Bryobacteraceae bacterium]|nr:hypothetical protein [Bryobacteraceae bacterium]
MFPGVNGFHFSAGHLIFLGVFFTVVAIVAVTVLMAVLRSWRTFREGRAEQVLWLSDFHDLPKADRACRHAITGECEGRTCARGFDCRECENHAKMASPAAAQQEEVFGLPYPSDRFYHRGHTWVKAEEDGTVLVGLDEIGRRLAGKPDELRLPAPGTPVSVNGTAWHMRRGQAEARVLAPVDGIVVETGGSQGEWWLRVKPATSDFSHLLRGAEVSAWVRRELDRLQLALPSQGLGTTLADGGVLVEDIASACTGKDLDNLYGKMFLEP